MDFVNMDVLDSFSPELRNFKLMHFTAVCSLLHLGASGLSLEVEQGLSALGCRRNLHLPQLHDCMRMMQLPPQLREQTKSGCWIVVVSRPKLTAKAVTINLLVVAV